MARQRRGAPGADAAAAKWRNTMYEIYGGAEGLRAQMQKMGHIGGVLSRGGGFASDKIGSDGLTGRQRASIAGAKGGKISRRTKKVVKDDIDLAEEILEEESGRNRNTA